MTTVRLVHNDVSLVLNVEDSKKWDTVWGNAAWISGLSGTGNGTLVFTDEKGQQHDISNDDELQKVLQQSSGLESGLPTITLKVKVTEPATPGIGFGFIEPLFSPSAEKEDLKIDVTPAKTVRELIQDFLGAQRHVHQCNALKKHEIVGPLNSIHLALRSLYDVTANGSVRHFVNEGAGAIINLLTQKVNLLHKQFMQAESQIEDLERRQQELETARTELFRFWQTHIHRMASTGQSGQVLVRQGPGFWVKMNLMAASLSDDGHKLHVQLVQGHVAQSHSVDMPTEHNWPWMWVPIVERAQRQTRDALRYLDMANDDKDHRKDDD